MTARGSWCNYSSLLLNPNAKLAEIGGFARLCRMATTRNPRFVTATLERGHRTGNCCTHESL